MPIVWKPLPDPGRIIARGTSRGVGPAGGLEVAGELLAAIPPGYRFVRLKMRADAIGRKRRQFVEVVAAADREGSDT